MAEVVPDAAASTDDPNIPGPFTTIITGENFNDAFVSRGPTGQYVVGFQLDGDGADAFFEFTSQNIGRQMAVVLDKEVISAPVINAAISSEGTIEGPPLAEVEQLVVQLKAGSLDVPLNVVSSRTVGPTLGQEAIDRSIIAGLVGLGAVALFMIFYYRLPGLLSVAALIIYTMVTFALFKVIPVTLTLAGIAGFVLSIGMAVDANVLIFARLKEELRTGRPLQNAIEAGFDHAWPSIRDSNISTMITSAILYWFGNYTGASIITGFALTLFIGVAISMFTAITVSRTFLRLIVGHGIATNLWWFAVDQKEAAPQASPATATSTYRLPPSQRSEEGPLDDSPGWQAVSLVRDLLDRDRSWNHFADPVRTEAGHRLHRRHPLGAGVRAQRRHRGRANCPSRRRLRWCDRPDQLRRRRQRVHSDPDGRNPAGIAGETSACRRP